MPVTTPLLFTVATEVLLLSHVPPLVPVAVSVVVELVHTVPLPFIVPAFTDAATDICFCALTGPVQPFTV